MNQRRLRAILALLAVVSIPIIMIIHRKDKTEQSFKGYLPATNVHMNSELQEALAMAAGLERRQAIATIKKTFKEQVPGRRRRHRALL